MTGIINTFVLLVTFSSKSFGATLKSFSTTQFTGTGTPPHKDTQGEYDTYDGSGISTSSPGFNNALKARSMPSLAPTVTKI